MKLPPSRRRTRWPVVAACLTAVAASLGLVGWGAMATWQSYTDNPASVASETVAAVPLTSLHCSGGATPYASCPDTSGDVSLSWGAVGGSPGYTLYRSGSPAGPYTQLTTLAGTAASYTDTSAAYNAQYYYQLVSEASPGWPPGIDTEMALSLPPSGGVDATRGNGGTAFSAANLAAMAVAGDGSTYTTRAAWGGATVLTGATIHAASCASVSQCWLDGGTGGRGGAGAVWTTGDGGATWTRQTVPPRTPALLGLRCVSTSLCWAVGQGGTILVTGDGGTTWTAQASGLGGRGAPNLTAISCPDASHCWVVGDATGGRRGGGAAVILATGDGGTTWTAQSSGVTVNLLGVSCPTTTQCWAVGSGGTILTTADGGATWTAQTSGTTQNLNGVRFMDGLNGWAVGDAGTALATTDGGLTWTPQTSGTTGNLLAVKMVSPSTGWAVGVGGTILHTSDGGVTWTAQTSGTTQSVNAVAAGSALDAVVGLSPAGFFGGGSPSALATHDGGATWSIPASQYVQWTFSPQVVSGSPVGSVVLTLVDQASRVPSFGTSASLLVSTDSGATWTTVGIANPTTALTAQTVPLSSLVTSAAQVSGLELRYTVTVPNSFFATRFTSTFDLVHVDVN